MAAARRWVAHALARDPQFAGAYLVSSEIERVADDKAASARVLEQGLARLPQAANLHYALGLALVRLEQKPEALKHLARAVALAPDDGTFVYTYAVALHNKGEPPRAIELLEQTLRGQPENGQLLEQILRIGLRPAASRSCWSATCRPSSRYTRTTLCWHPCGPRWAGRCARPATARPERTGRA